MSLSFGSGNLSLDKVALQLLERRHELQKSGFKVGWKSLIDFGKAYKPRQYASKGYSLDPDGNIETHFAGYLHYSVQIFPASGRARIAADTIIPEPWSVLVELEGHKLEHITGIKLYLKQHE